MKRILLTLILFLGISLVYAQPNTPCVTSVFLSEDTIDCGDTVDVTINSFAEAVLNDTFDLSGPTDPNWSSTMGAVYNNPYIPSPPFPGSGNADGGTYFWMGSTTILPNALVSAPLNVSFGGQICFDMAYAVQGQPAPTEGPDQYDEGVSVQYSLDGGVTWIDIVYYAPNGDVLPANPMTTAPGLVGNVSPYNQWTTLCITLPPGALSASTSFQWIQQTTTSPAFDHWGLDNIQILAADPAYGLFDDLGNFIPNNMFPLSPNQTTTYNYLYTNGINDTCYSSATIYVNETDAGPDIQVACDGLGIPLSVTGVAASATVSWSPAAGLSDASDPNPFANPANDTEYIITSMCDVDTINVFVEDVFDIVIAEPDTICVNGSTFINLSTTPTSVPINNTQWDNVGTLNSPSGNQVLASPLATTTYVATVTSDSGCVIQDSVNVYVQGVAATISVNPNDPRVCIGGDVDLFTVVDTPAVPYTLVQGSYNPYPLTGTVIGGLADDNTQGPLPISFNFPFFGTNYTSLWISSNGFITFTAPTGAFPFNVALPSPNNPNNIIAWGWDDLNFTTSGTFSFYTGGSSPNSYMVLNFVDVAYDFGPAGTEITVQVVLYENGLIEINNINVVPENGFTSMTQGIENATGTEALWPLGYNSESITSIGENWSYIPFAPPSNPTYTWMPGATLNTTSGPNVTASPSATTEYFVTMQDGFCSSTAAVTVNVDSLVVNSISPDILLECPEDSIQLNVDAQSTIFNSLLCGAPAGICNGAQTIGQVGTGTGVSGTGATGSTGNTPFGYWFANGKRHIKYTAAELSAMGFTGGNIYSFAMNIVQKNTVVPFPLFEIGMKCVPSGAPFTDISETGFTSVYSNPSYSTTIGWNTFSFATPYVWDGVSDILVQVCFGTGTTPWEDNDHVEVTATAGNALAWGFQDNPGSPGCTHTAYTSTGTTGNKPNARFDFCNVTPGFADVTYNWTSNPTVAYDDVTITDPLILDEITQTTNAIVEITDGTCTITDTVVITFGGGYTLTADTAVCVGNSVQLVVTGGTNPTWTPNDGTLSSVTIPNPVATPLTTTSYSVNLDLANCNVTDTVVVTVNALPSVEINNGDAQAGVCDGVTANLVSDADPLWSNVWTGPETGSGTTLNVTTQGTYTITSIDANGCTDTDDILVSVTDNPVLDPNLVRNVLCCNDQGVVVNFQDLVTNNVTLDESFWDNSPTASGTSVTVNANEDGTYDLLVVSVDGCEATAQITFETNCMNPDITDVDSIALGGSVAYNVTTDITTVNEVWTPNFTGNTFTANTVANAYETVVVETEASFVLNDGSDFSCFEEDSSQIYIFLVADPVMPDAFTPNKDNMNERLFPVNVDPSTPVSAFRVYNRWGEVVYEYDGSDSGWDGTWKGADQPADIYNYYYVVDKLDKDFVSSGTITLIR